MKQIVKQAFVATVPVLTGYIVLGFGFGIILKTAGYGIFLAFMMSLLIYAGSMQYVAIGLLTGGASLVTIALTTLMVNARHLFYGISMLDKYKQVGKIKPYLLFALTDETYSLVCSENAHIPQEHKNTYYFFVSFFNHCYWVTGSVLGAVIGEFVNLNFEGVEFALTALFLTVFVEQWLSTDNHFPAVTGVAASVACLLVFGSGSFLIPAMLVIALILCLSERGQKHE